MMIRQLKLVNFRSFEKKELDFGSANVVVGENGCGKSNLIEAIYLLATGKSFRADLEGEMVRYGEAFFRIIGQIGQLRQMGQINEMGIVMDGGRKKFEINGIPRRMVDAVGKFRAVLFGPRDMDLVTGSPGVRRRYLDFVISQTDREYRRCLVSYEKGLRQRNKVLENIREGMATRSQLYFWDRLLIRDGEYIMRRRGEYLIGLDRTNKTDGTYRTYYDKSVISEARLKQYEEEEVAAATTLVGPHRDDFAMEMGPDFRDVAKYGSRGEQRMAILWLKTGERDYLTVENELPVLLLDDVFSELDHKHREEVENIIDDQTTSGGQVIMTTADEHLLPKTGNWNIIRL